jgi:bifunctional oxygenase/reductase
VSTAGGSFERTQVVVAGGGPVGLLLAGELRLGGADVVVLEALAEPSTESRASTLHARTMEIFDSRGLLDALGQPPCDLRGHFGGIPLDLTLPGPYPGQWKVLQARTAEVLEEWARGLGADVRRGHEVVRLVVDGDHVEVEAVHGGAQVLVRADYVVACDGEESTVRRLTGTRLDGRAATCELLRGDVAGIEVPDRRFQRLPGGLAVAARRPDGVTRVMVCEFGREPAPRPGEPAFEELVEAWQRVTGESIGAGEPLWVNAFDDATGQVARYRDGRVLFAGDAAHRQPPIGGQALNLGLQDAANLGWKLAARVTGRAGDELLDSYHEERHAVGARTLGNIAAQAGLLFGGPEVEPLRSVLGELMTDAGTQARLAGMVTGLDVRYDLGEGQPAVAGARLPPAELVTASGRVTTSALLRAGQGLVLLLGDPLEDLLGDRGTAGSREHAELRRIASGWPDRVRVVVAAAVPGLPAAVLVRPDGHVAWVPGSPGTADSALRRWFGPPRAADTPLAGKTALVTEAGHGPGRAVALRLADRGALVAVHFAGDRAEDKEAADEVVGLIVRGGGRAFAVRADLDVPAAVDDFVRELGHGVAGTPDILVVNAGRPPDDGAGAGLDRLLTAAARTPFLLIERMLPLLGDDARIVTVSAGAKGIEGPDGVAAAVAAAAAEALARGFAELLGPRGITVNTVVPGAAGNGTRRAPEVADVVAALVAGDAHWITGTLIGAAEEDGRCSKSE